MNKKPLKGNPHGLTVKQHCFPCRAIVRLNAVAVRCSCHCYFAISPLGGDGFVDANAPAVVLVDWKGGSV